MACVSYDTSAKTLLYKQNKSDNCTVTSAGMAMKVPQATLINDFPASKADWDGMKNKYGFSLTSDESTTLSKIIAILKTGWPVVTQINNSSEPHWVLITKFAGDDLYPQAANFICSDPATGTSVTLNKAARWANVYQTHVYKK